MDGNMEQTLNTAARLSPAIRVLAAGKNPLPDVTYVAESDIGDCPCDDRILLPPDLWDETDPIEILRTLTQEWTKPDEKLLAVVKGHGGFLVSPKRPGIGRMEGRIVVVTGGAQGLGFGIAEALILQGASIVIADINEETMCDAVQRLDRLHPDDNRVLSVHTDVTDEKSIERLVRKTVLTFGGLDLFISNAGILRAGGLQEMSLQDFEQITRVNYTALFLCARYASLPMVAANRADPSYFADIIQINSKSGLQGSNRNFAYAGGKFGGIGLVQSLALELAAQRVKVNAVCPGNYFDGPLWSDPLTGLFQQYLESGKVPGATCVEDVYRSYVDKVPMGRGCMPADVARAIMYLVEQEYETGQALPVTGGQVMLH